MDKKPNAKALLPIVVFLVLYLGCGIYFEYVAPAEGQMGFYVVSVVVWILALSRVEVSVAYPMLSIGYVVNAGLAWYLFDEAVGPQRLAGIAVIIVGVVIVARS